MIEVCIATLVLHGIGFSAGNNDFRNFAVFLSVKFATSLLASLAGVR